MKPDTINSANPYLDKLIHHFIRFVVPRGKTVGFVSSANSSRKILKKYDYIILVQILEETEDIIDYLKYIHTHLVPGGRLVVIYQNYLYSFFGTALRSFGREKKNAYNWLSKTDILAFLKLTGFAPLLSEPLCLVKKELSLISEFTNRLLLFFFPFNHLSPIHYTIAAKPIQPVKKTISIIIPARNEEGNIPHIFSQLPEMEAASEVIFVEGHSLDKTREEIQNNIAKFKNKKGFSFKLLQQTGKGKADAVHLGIKKASGEIVIIYDADMTVKAGDLPKFYKALTEGLGDFINGSRLVYPIEEGAMQLLNIFGNKVFSLIFTFIFGSPLKDTLCGTKAFYRQDYLLFKKQEMDFLKKEDPFGDFYLLFGARKLNLRIVDLPVRYYARSYGATNISRFKNAWELFQFSLISFKKLKMRL